MMTTFDATTVLLLTGGLICVLVLSVVALVSVMALVRRTDQLRAQYEEVSSIVRDLSTRRATEDSK